MRHAALAVLLALAAAPAFADAPDCNAPGIAPPTPANNHAMIADDYPAMSTVEGEEGVTMLSILISESGHVQDTKVVTSSGFARLDDAAAAAARMRWLYAPARKDGTPVACWWKTRVVWKLNGYGLDAVSSNFSNIIQMGAKDYPSGAASRKEAGVTMLAVAISKTGTLNDVRVMHSSGFADLDDAAVAAMRTRFHPGPGSLDGKPAVTILFVAVGWSLN
jgi:TonB family protein